MAKEVRGWRDKEWDPDSEMGRIILEMVTGEDGWSCPHCFSKEEMETCEDITHASYHRLMDDEEAIEIRCRHCGECYHLKCHTRRNYYTCKDETFEE